MSFQIFTMELLIDVRWMVVIFVTLFNLMNQPILCLGKYDFDGVPHFHQVYVRINAALKGHWTSITSSPFDNIFKNKLGLLYH